MSKSLILSLLLLPLSAVASTVLGNPTSGVVLVDGSSVYVDNVVAHRCSSGTQVVSIADVLGQDDSQAFTVDEDEFCSIDVNIAWKVGGTVVTVPVSGFGSFKVTSGAAVLLIELDASTETAVLN